MAQLTKDHLKFRALTLLEALANDFTAYSGALKGADSVLKPVFDHLVAGDMVELKDGNYVATDKGKSVVKCYLERKQDWHNMYEVYSKIDLETGDFAWEQTVEDPSEISEMLSENRWSDLRYAVAEFKGLDLSEVAFFILLENNGFVLPGSGEKWQKGFIDDKVFTMFHSIKYGMVKVSDLDFDDWDLKASGRDVVRDIIKVGAQINLFTYKNLEARVGDFSEKFDVTVPDQMDKDTPKNYLKASWVAPCWRWNLASGKVQNKPCGLSW